MIDSKFKLIAAMLSVFLTCCDSSNSMRPMRSRFITRLKSTNIKNINGMRTTHSRPIARLQSTNTISSSKDKIDVLDERGKPTGEVLSRKEIHALGKIHRAVHLYLFDKKIIFFSNVGLPIQATTPIC